MESAAPASRLHLLPIQGSSSSTAPSSRSATLQPFPVSAWSNTIPALNPPNAGFPGPSQPRSQAFAGSANSMHQSSRVAYQSTVRPAVTSRQNQNFQQSAMRAPLHQRNFYAAPHRHINAIGQPIRPQAAPSRSFPNATYATIPTSSSFPLMTSGLRTRIPTNDRRDDRPTRQDIMAPDRQFRSELEDDLTK